jgi:hypothetical protein
MRIHSIVPALALAVLAGLGSVGCSKQLSHTVLPNQPPTVRLTWAPIDTQSEVFYIYKLNWVGYDPDGRVTGFEYAVDPPRGSGGVINWRDKKRPPTSTLKNEETFRFESATPESAFQQSAVPRSEGFHVFAIRAVDNGNPSAFSEPVERAFYSFGVAPTVQILEPAPQELLTPRVSPAVRITWTGKDFIDPNGYAFEKPLYYKYTIFKKGNPGVNWTDWLEEPDSLRRQVAPEFAGWDSIAPEVPEVQFTNLTTNSEYLFVVVAFGRSGAYSPIFSLRTNMLRVLVGLAGELGPKITLFNSFFQYTYQTGGFSLDFERAIQLQVPAEVPITFNWTAEPPLGSIMRRYRWVLDLVALDDERPRTSQDDWYHWSPWSQATAATVGPFVGAEGDTGEIHNFYLEAEDINGLVSLGWVQFRVYRPTFDRDLLVVNDTRFQSDEIAIIQPPGRSDSLRAPYGVWPSRAELDTFLFAVGGVPWKMKTGNPPSPQGLFRGYSFDTLGTRYGQVIPTAPLGLLGHYKHIVWMTDKAAGYELASNSPTYPTPTLLYMSARDRQNTLSTWVSQGGQLWALGGGFGNATNKLWNNLSNDVNQIRTYRYDGLRPDLTPGRFMFDLAHWRTEFRVYGPVFVRFSRYDQPDPTVIGSPKPPTYWKGFPNWNPPDHPAYLTLPTTLQFRSPATDPLSLWPDRRSNTEYYVGNRTYSSIGTDIEFLCVAQSMLEQIPAPTKENPDLTVERSTLDSLYLVYGSGYPKQMNQSSAGEGVNAVMTYYHGLECAPLVFSGMSIWDFRRQDNQALVDFVLNGLWKLTKRPLYTAPRATAPSFVRRGVVPTPQTPQRPPGSVRQPVGASTFQRWR